MPRTTPSLSWLADRYSRLQGAIQRCEVQIAKSHQRLAFHRSHVEQYERHLVRLELSLATARLQLPAMERALRLHEDAAEPHAVAPVTPQEGPRPLRYGQMTQWLYQTLRTAPDRTLSTDQLHAALIEHLKAAPDASAHLRYRLQIRLNILRGEGKLEALDPPRARGRRWTLPERPPAARPQRPSPRTRRRNSGTAMPALWLIRTQQQLRVALRQTPTSNRKTRQRLRRNLRAVQRAWALHPMWFPIDPDRLPADTPYRIEVRRQVIARLVTMAWTTLDELYTSSPRLAIQGRYVAIDAIKKALKHLVLEGRVIHRRLRSDLQVEWRLSDAPSVD